MPASSVRRLLLTAVVAMVTSAVAVASAAGVAGVPDVTRAVPSLQPPASLPDTPSVPSVPSVPVPDVPDVPVPSAPSAPSVPDAPAIPDAPSLPDAPAVPGTPSAPGVPATPSVPDVRLPGGAGPGGDSAPVSAREIVDTNGDGSVSPAEARAADADGDGKISRQELRIANRRALRKADANTPAARRARRAERERKLRQTVTSLSGCLGLLPPRRGRMLALRAGLGGAAPLSRGAAAAKVGVSASRAARIESRALRQLRRAGRSGGCGASTPAGSLVGGSVPRLQPAVLLEPQPALRPTAELGGAPGEEQAVKSVTASSDSPTGEAKTTAGLPFKPIAQAVNGDGPGLWLVMLAALATAAATMLLLRRRTEGGPAAAPAPPVSSAPWPAVEAEPASWAPAAPAPGTALELRADPLIPDMTGTHEPPAVVDEPEVGETVPFFKFVEAASEAIQSVNGDASAPDEPVDEPRWAPEAPVASNGSLPEPQPAQHRGRRAAVAVGSVASLLATALIRRRRR